MSGSPTRLALTEEPSATSGGLDERETAILAFELEVTTTKSLRGRLISRSDVKTRRVGRTQKKGTSND